MTTPTTPRAAQVLSEITCRVDLILDCAKHQQHESTLALIEQMAIYVKSASGAIAKLQAAPQAAPALLEQANRLMSAQVPIDPEIAQATAKGFHTMFDDAPQAAQDTVGANEAIYAAWKGCGLDTIPGSNWPRFVGMLPPLYTHPTPSPAVAVPDDSDASDMNKLHGEAYGVDWVYAPSPTGAVPDEVLLSVISARRRTAISGIDRVFNEGVDAAWGAVRAALATQQAQTEGDAT